MSQIPITADDLDTFFEVDEFAQVITYNLGTINGIVTDLYSDIDVGEVGIEGANLLAIVKTSDISGIAEGDAMAVGAENFTVVNIRPDNTGLTRIQLARV